MASHLHCYGLGYCAEALGRALRAEGWRVSGTSRDDDKRAVLQAAGYEIAAFDEPPPATARYVLVSTPPDEAGDPVLARHRAALAARSDWNWIGYLSTTGVYGDAGGAWVDEATPPAPTLSRTQRRVAAEQAWRALGLPVHVFRLAGIYGPGRSQLETVAAGTARRIVKPGQVFSRIHVADIVQVLRASMARPAPGAIYNLADDEPAAPDEVVAFAADLLGVSPPPAVAFEEADLSPMARSFYADNRRVRNEKIKRELGVVLQFPTYRKGLVALARTRASG